MLMIQVSETSRCSIYPYYYIWNNSYASRIEFTNSSVSHKRVFESAYVGKCITMPCKIP